MVFMVEKQDFKQLVKRLDPDESQVENIFQFYMVQYKELQDWLKLLHLLLNWCQPVIL